MTPSVAPLLLRMVICIAIASSFLYAYMQRQNDLIALRLSIPLLSKELKGLTEENIRLQYLIDRFESPIHLMELARQPEYSHLKHPYTRDVLFIRQGSKAHCE
jgi:hypothetical protein